MRLFFHIIPIIFIISCSSPAPPSAEPNDLIDLTGLWDSKKMVNLSEVADSIEYVFLETNDKCLLHDINQLEVVLDSDKIYIIPQKENIKVFSTSGKYLFDIGGRGEGPSEYKRARLLIDPIHKAIWILDNSQHKLLKYAMDGTFLSTTQVGKYVCRLGLIESSQLVGLNLPLKNLSEKTELLYFDESGQVSKTVQLYQSNEAGVGNYYMNDPLFEQTNGKFHFAEMPFMKVVEMNDSGSWDTKWNIDSGAKKPKKESSSPSLENTFITKLIETKDYFFIEGLKNRRSQYFLYNKSLGQTKATRVDMETLNVLSDVTGLMNDIDGGLPFWPNSSGNRNRYVSIFNALQLIDLCEGNVTYHHGKQTTPISKELNALVESLRPDSNPIIMLAYLKH